MIKLIKNISNDWINISIWTLFSIAVIRCLSLVNVNFYFYYLILPGLLLFIYLFYYYLKTSILLKFSSYILSITIMSIGFLAFGLLVRIFISLNYYEGDLLRYLVMFLASILLASLLYFIVYLIKKAYKACRAQ
jgi:hypothetical protein